MPGTSPQSEIVRDYLQRFPSYPSRRIANMVTSACPGVFSDEESARNMVRYYRGAMGNEHRSYVRNRIIPRIEVPESDSDPWEPLELTAADFPAIAGGDFQIPFHDPEVVEMFIARAVEIKAKTALLMGDFVDAYMLSHFLRDPRRRKYPDEVMLTRKILGIIRTALPKARIIWKLGNHEFRLLAYLMRLAPELFGLDVMSFENVYDLKRLRIETVDDKRLIRYKQLHLLHGHEYRGGMIAPVNPARTLFLKAKRSAAWWHFHRSNSHTDKAINDDITTTWSVGCMCGLHPEFMPLNDWQHGFAEIYADDEGAWTFRNRRIRNYRYED